MIELPLAAEIQNTPRGTGFGIVCAEYQAPDACLKHRADAHGTGFQSDEKRCIIQSIITRIAAGRSECNNFGVAGRIMIHDRTVAATGDNVAVPDDHRTDRYLPAIRGRLRFTDGGSHELLVPVRPVKAHDGQRSLFPLDCN